MWVSVCVRVCVRVCVCVCVVCAHFAKRTEITDLKMGAVLPPLYLRMPFSEVSPTACW